MDRITNMQLNDVQEDRIEKSLRPSKFDEVIGREHEITNLKVMIEAAKKRDDALDHIIFYGPPGLGKTSISNVVANEMGVPIHITSGPAIEKQGDLASILTNIEDKGILFIDEIHRLSKVIEEILYPAMEDRAIDIIIGKGPSAKTLRLELNRFTLVGATTKMGKLSSPLRDRFGASFRFDFYEFDELAEIIVQKAQILKTEIDPDSAYLIAERSRRTPRIAIRILKRIRDFADVNNDGIITRDEVVNALKTLNIDPLGLDYLDQKILHVLVREFDSKPVGLSTIAAAISEEMDTIEDVCEPFLLQEGLIQRTSRGRIATEKAIKHLADHY
ncbi:Holliday junction branch migration DNA helicase RuvB [Candidatus Dojkabacteria bacterium]|uniref:Holliday junction branch migration complex subunit RuvB n=1 Tax=Candidatus Dojkabacteria bacterium TaxID=2099670 RepID=A0A955L9X5_9BACT|nr:Holliday junction branch migration DNA helicase RuvB [Candidatus Dojkabacteria bacterium]